MSYFMYLDDPLYFLNCLEGSQINRLVNEEN